VNDEGKLREVDYPNEAYNYHMSPNERAVTVKREAVDEWFRLEALKFLSVEGLETVRLPLGAQADEPHVPILVSKDLDQCQHVILFLGEAEHDMGVLASRLAGDNPYLDATAVPWVRYVNKVTAPHGRVGIIISNPAARLWHRRSQKAVSVSTWDALPRATAIDPAPLPNERNMIPRNADQWEHTECVFDQIVKRLIECNVKIDIVAVWVAVFLGPFEWHE
jgi:hypothetical protein